MNYIAIIKGKNGFITYPFAKRDKELLYNDLSNICDLATGFEDKSARLEIENKSVNRKAKWAYDICVTIDNIDKKDIIKNIGTLPKIKIIKNKIYILNLSLTKKARATLKIKIKKVRLTLHKSFSG